MNKPPILFEDSCIVVLDKPSGMLVAPDRWDKEAANLMAYVHARMSPDIFNAHRLDRDASGVVLCAKTKPALRDLVKQYEAREVGKRCVALVVGVPTWTEKDMALRVAPDEATPGRMRVARDGGKAAETRFRVLDTWQHYALVEAIPLTERAHQIRIHLAAAGHPVVADTLYGDGRAIYLSEMKRNYKFKPTPERPLIGALALHAESLTFRHPESGATLTIHAPLPHDFEVAVKYLNRFGK